ncbi:hypothetical protein [Chryseobacterium sp. Leaf201]|uniref:hypothetical protein n=1 Tax=Chryseobacterium sp. Leaf201 TaxID=1735672 RepID=UPI0012FE9948|nr:hypothetical protein [Chryseobacterium sp. Leaf201]
MIDSIPIFPNCRREAQKWGGLPLGVGVRIVGGSGESFIAAKRREKFFRKPSILTGKNF